MARQSDNAVLHINAADKVYLRVMRTNIDIDDELLARAAELFGTTTKKATVEHALRELVRLHDAQSILDLRGKVPMRSLDEIRGPAA